MEKIVKNLGGHSGCKISLMKKNDRFFVRKISSSYEYNERLLLQINKQKSFVSKRVRTPMVYAEGTLRDGLIYFDMEYIQGITLAKGIGTYNISQMCDLVECIMDIFELESVETVQKSPELIFQKKLDILKSDLADINNSIVEAAISYLEKTDWNAIPVTRCHGDLTFENIIMRNGHLYIIDFLDSFYDSWMMDASTLLQDSLMLWSYRGQKEIDTNLRIKLMVFKDILEARIKEISPKYVWDIHKLLLLKLIRIYPYVKEDFEREYLDCSVKKMMNILKREENSIE